MRPVIAPTLPPRKGSRQSSGLFDEMIVDNFAGAGGASMGIEAAIGRSVDIAINHDKHSVSMHQVNHPHTRHLCEDVWQVDPAEATTGRPVGLAWFSPDCKHFSRAKGGKPVEKKIRGLAWVVIRWAKAVKPRVIILENVREFQEWGPEVRAFLVKYFGSGGQWQECDEPLHTVVSRDRFGLVTVDGQDYAIADIGLRMLTPRELLNAQFGKYAKNYVLIGTKAQQVAGIGNSVPPELAEAMVRANYCTEMEVAA